MTLPSSLDILRRLIAIDTTSVNPNMALIDYVSALLADHGIASTLVHDATGAKANLFASVGPQDVPGLLLSGHTDVVPVAGQNWTVPPFELTERDGLLYGRGTADMKGYVACAIAALIAASKIELKQPLQLALSYDEEVGCLGVGGLIDLLEKAPVRPFLCVVGEPTSMQLAIGHKGKMALRATCCGLEGHSALAPKALNAIHLACDFVETLRQTQARLEREGLQDDDYDIPYTTVHVGRIDGGRALNIVPNLCTVDFEIRHLAGEDTDSLLKTMHADAEQIAAASRARAPQASITISDVFSYPGLDTQRDSEAVRYMESLFPELPRKFKVAFGTEGGLFTRHLEVPVVVCGPGSMDQGHKPDEFVARSQLDACDAFMQRLVERLRG
jgi:acetylornithine deacetylase